MKNIKIKIKILKWFPRYREYLLTNSNMMAGHFQAEPTSAYSLVWEYCPCCVRVEQLIATSGQRNFFKVFDAMRRCPIFNLFCRRNDLSDLLSRHYQLINSRGFSRLPVLPPSPTIPLQRSWPRRWLWHNRPPPPFLIKQRLRMTGVRCQTDEFICEREQLWEPQERRIINWPLPSPTLNYFSRNIRQLTSSGDTKCKVEDTFCEFSKGWFPALCSEF